jgi:DNA repair exonuclease SbcCD ATPase subunit
MTSPTPTQGGRRGYESADNLWTFLERLPKFRRSLEGLARELNTLTKQADEDQPLQKAQAEAVGVIAALVTKVDARLEELTGNVRDLHKKDYERAEGPRTSRRVEEKADAGKYLRD